VRPDLRALLLVLLAAAALGVAAPAGAQPAAPELTAATPYPLRGEPVEIRLTGAGRPMPGVAIRATYRPNSETAHTEEIGLTGADGTLRWTPEVAGVVTLQAMGAAGAAPLASAQVAVRFGSFPPLGLAVMVFAAVLLFGGAGLGFWLLLRPPAHPPATEPPST
jgi:hypothetical protein